MSLVTRQTWGNVGSDSARKKPTFPAIIGLEALHEKSRGTASECVTGTFDIW